MADWSKIKAEYIRDESASLRKLAQKYGVPRTGIEKRSRDEKWVELRRRKKGKAEAAVVDACATKEADQAIAIYEVADMAITRIREALESGEVGAQGLKQLTSALRDIAAVKGLQTEAEKREQEARIAKLRREAEGEERKDTSYQIEFVGMDWDVKNAEPEAE